MAADCVNVNIIGSGAAAPASRELPTATADTSAINTAVANALANAAPDYDSTADIEAIQAAVNALPVNFDMPSGDVTVLWNTEKVTNKNQMRAALRVAMRMVDSEASLVD